MRDELYRTLNVPRDAGAEEIKRAYKRKASATHPDQAGGDKAAFQAVAHAYSVLSVPKRRQAYDAGEPDQYVDEQSQLLQEIAKLLFDLVESCPDLERFDVVEAARTTLRNQIKEALGQKTKAQEKIDKMRAALKRLRNRKRKPNMLHVGAAQALEVLAHMLESNMKNYQQVLKNVDEHVKHIEAQLDILADYAYEVEAPTTGFRFTTSPIT